ncbi:MAG: NADP-specific glutamate dehydrogenase [Clostridia bacterium]
MNDYLKSVLDTVYSKCYEQTEFIQTVNEVFSSIEPMVIANEKEYRENALIERLVEPDRQVLFRVPWVDDKGIPHVNRGYRVQFNGAIGPYKGGLRFHPSVNLSIVKFLGFEQTFKNSLTGLSMGGGKGGSDFDPKGKSRSEVMRFCQSFMTELYRHIGPNVDVPAGDIGVGGREIGFLFGQYKRIVNSFDNGVLTGKGSSFGGSEIRPEATGYGATYFLKDVLERKGEGIKGKTFALSGYGNVAWGSCKKIAEFGGKVVTLSGHDGYIYDKDGITGDKIDYLLEMRESGKGGIKRYADKFGVDFYADQTPWGKVPADIYMPCATQNEIHLKEAKEMVKLGVGVLNEVSNMPTTNEAIEYLQENKVIICPSKAANAGGVAVSGLEMSQNSERMTWSSEEVDNKLIDIMTNIHKQIVNVLDEYGMEYDLVKGANMAGFKKVAEAMISQGII